MIHSLFINESELLKIKQAIQTKTDRNLFVRSFTQLRDRCLQYLQEEVSILGNGVAGGKEHNAHLRNSTIIQELSLAYKIDGSEIYAEKARDYLLGYAQKYLTLDFAKGLTQNPPGRLFHQILNEQMFLIKVVEGYSYLNDYLSEQEKNKIKNNLIIPICELMINSGKFDIIHNHGIWAVSVVGIAGVVLGKSEYVGIAVNGLNENKTKGFLAQLDLLLSPDGYYEEGPYYLRFSLWPMFLFAEALKRYYPKYDIYGFKDSLIKKTLYSILDLSLKNGRIPSLNDSYKSTSIYEVGGSCIGFMYATSLIFENYEQDERLLWIAQHQRQVMISIAGLNLANKLEKVGEVKYIPSISKEIGAGSDGSKGAIGFLKTLDKNNEEFRVMMSYGTHGMSEHGHFDALSIMINANNSEFLTDYGCARWAGMSLKNESTYTPENFSYAKQTIAHNTLVVDQTTHHLGDGKLAEKYHCFKHIFDISDENFQIMSAVAEGYHKGCNMQRTICLLKDSDEFEQPAVIDLFKVDSNDSHIYDLPFHYLGHNINFGFANYPSTDRLNTVGEAFGYQHLWKEGVGKPEQDFSLTWLYNRNFYSVSSAVISNTRVIWGKTGANDPNYHLRSEPFFILRQNGSNNIFANVMETHGEFNEAKESCINSQPNVKKVKVIANRKNGFIVVISLHSGTKYTIFITNKDYLEEKEHIIKVNNIEFKWSGAFKLLKEVSSTS